MSARQLDRTNFEGAKTAIFPAAFRARMLTSKELSDTGLHTPYDFVQGLRVTFCDAGMAALEP